MQYQCCSQDRLNHDPDIAETGGYQHQNQDTLRQYEDHVCLRQNPRPKRKQSHLKAFISWAKGEAYVALRRETSFGNIIIEDFKANTTYVKDTLENKCHNLLSLHQ